MTLSPDNVKPLPELQLTLISEFILTWYGDSCWKDNIFLMQLYCVFKAMNKTSINLCLLDPVTRRIDISSLFECYWHHSNFSLHSNTHWPHFLSTQPCHRFRAKCCKCIVLFNSHWTLYHGLTSTAKKVWYFYLFLNSRVCFCPDIILWHHSSIALYKNKG